MLLWPMFSLFAALCLVLVLFAYLRCGYFQIPLFLCNTPSFLFVCYLFCCYWHEDLLTSVWIWRIHLFRKCYRLRLQWRFLSRKVNLPVQLTFQISLAMIGLCIFHSILYFFLCSGKQIWKWVYWLYFIISIRKRCE